MIDADPLAEVELRELVPAVIGVLVGRGADFTTAEDAVQDALIEALRTWPEDPPRDRRGWLVTVAWRKFLDAVRSEGSRARREERVAAAASRRPATCPRCSPPSTSCSTRATPGISTSSPRRSA